MEDYQIMTNDSKIKIKCDYVFPYNKRNDKKSWVPSIVIHKIIFFINDCIQMHINSSTYGAKIIMILSKMSVLSFNS